ncbi:MAG TPA: spore coat protein GerQ [Bacillota bacterium]|nr:spore coat protein GerQ [Bacillota bacterium]
MSEKKANQFHMGYFNSSYYPPAYQAYYPYAPYGFRQYQPSQQIPFAPSEESAQAQNTTGTTPSGMPQQLPAEQSYIENILRLNQGKEVSVHMNFEEENQPEQVFNGVIEAAGRDHIILSEPETGKRYLLLMVYLNYVVFDEKINYNPAFGGGDSANLFTTSSR